MLLDSPEPISAPCARTVEPAVAALLRLGITQHEVVEHLSRALGIVRCVLDYQQSIPRHQLAILSRGFWIRLRQIPDLPPETVQRVRSIILACTRELRRLPETACPPEETGPQPETAGVLQPVPRPSDVVCDADTAHSPAERPRPPEGPPLPVKGVQQTGSPRRRNAVPRPREKGAWDQPLLDFTAVHPSFDESEPPASDDTPLMPTASGLAPPDLTASNFKVDAPRSPVVLASGEKAKARDILTAIRVLKTIDNDLRPATAEERQLLVRFAGFGPVALSIFPDPVTGRFKDPSWQAVGEELKTLLTPEEYESAKRTTFNAFYTSPTVIAAMHEAIARLGISENSAILEPGCGTGNFMSVGPEGMRFIGIELDLISGRIAQALHPEQDIRIENFRDSGRYPYPSVFSSENITATATDEDGVIRDNFNQNITRVKNLVVLYETNPDVRGKGRKSTETLDILRAAVVFLHATLEDVLRSVAYWKLPSAGSAVLENIPLVGLGPNPKKFSLGELVVHRTKTVEALLTESVNAHLENSNFNDTREISKLLENVSIPVANVNARFAALQELMERRHQIVHRADRQPTVRGSGDHRIRAINKTLVRVWIAAVEEFAAALFGQLTVAPPAP